MPPAHAPTWPLDGSVTNAWLTMALWPVRPLGRQGGEVDRGSKGAKGEVGLANGSPFHPTHPGLVRRNDFKDASKAAPLLPLPLLVPTPHSTRLLRIPVCSLATLGWRGCPATDVISVHNKMISMGCKGMWRTGPGVPKARRRLLSSREAFPPIDIKPCMRPLVQLQPKVHKDATKARSPCHLRCAPPSAPFSLQLAKGRVQRYKI
jgi:hypothetical protein